MLAFRLDKVTTQRLEHLCAQTGRCKSHYARKALLQFLDDKEDYLLSIAALEKQGKTLNWRAKITKVAAK